MPATATRRPRAAAATAAPTLTTFALRLEAQAGPNPFGGTDLPALSESFTVQATDRRHAYRLAPARTTLRLMGQELEIYIDGTRELANA